MARRSRHGDDEGSLDSLLDTMTNVVGILVIVLVVVQLGVQEAVKRIGESQSVDVEALELLITELEATQKEKLDLEAELVSLDPDDQKLEELLKQLESTVAAKNSQLQITDKEKEEIEKNNSLARANQEKIEEHKEQRKSLSEQIAKTLEDVAKKEAVLEDKTQQKAPPPKVVNLPNPRPAPEGIRAAMFICTENRIYPLNLDELRKDSRKKLEAMFARNRKKYVLEEGKNWKIDGQKLVDEFNKTGIRDEYFSVELEVAGDIPRMVLNPRKNAGSTVSEVEKPRSRFQGMVSRLDGNKFYTRFFVKPDSYEAYVAARRVVQQGNYLAGWEPQGATWIYKTNLGGPVRFAPAPPPDPNAKPAPAGKPANVID